ncbi:MAG: hypothetical protein NVV73_08235 [Cellvibrionaceae bacterium]|nr:hypothetical protein [Cellvibrionaceae bacterium]
MITPLILKRESAASAVTVSVFFRRQAAVIGDPQGHLIVAWLGKGASHYLTVTAVGLGETPLVRGDVAVIVIRLAATKFHGEGDFTTLGAHGDHRDRRLIGQAFLLLPPQAAR